MQIISDSNRRQEAYNIVIVGCGATGSQLLPSLTQLLANNEGHRLTVIDQDIFEEKNMLNQKCLYKDLGKPKSEVLGTRYKKVYPHLDISYIDEYVTKPESLIKLLDIYGYIPVLVGCVDNNATRKLFHEVFQSKKLPHLVYIDSGNGTDVMTGQTVVGYKTHCGSEQVPDERHGYNVYRSRPLSRVLQPPVAEVFPDILEEDKSIETVLSCSDTLDEHPQNIGTNLMAATSLFTILNNLISFDEIIAHKVFFDAQSLNIASRD